MDTLQIEKIIDTVCLVTNVPRDDVMSKKRSGEIPMARHMCWVLMLNMTRLSLKVIASTTNCTNHTSVHRAQIVFANRYETEKDIRKMFKRAEYLLTGKNEIHLFKPATRLKRFNTDYKPLTQTGRRFSNIVYRSEQLAIRCLFELSNGLTRDQIARKFNIKYAKVVTSLLFMQTRHHCTNVEHLISFAFRTKLIS